MPRHSAAKKRKADKAFLMKKTIKEKVVSVRDDAGETLIKIVFEILIFKVLQSLGYDLLL